MTTQQFWLQAAKENGTADLAMVEEAQRRAVQDFNNEFVTTNSKSEAGWSEDGALIAPPFGLVHCVAAFVLRGQRTGAVPWISNSVVEVDDGALLSPQHPLLLADPFGLLHQHRQVDEMGYADVESKQRFPHPHSPDYDCEIISVAKLQPDTLSHLD